MTLLAHWYSWPPTDLLGLLFYVAIAAVVIVAIHEIWTKVLGWPVPLIARIVGIALLSIALIIIMFKVFAALVAA